MAGVGIWETIMNNVLSSKEDKKDNKPLGRNIPRNYSAYSYSMPMEMEPMSDEMFAALRERVTPGVATQRMGLQNMEEALADYQAAQAATPTQPNLTNLLGAVDAMAGTDLLKKYKAPKSEIDRKKDLAQMEALLSETARGLSKAEIDLLKAQFQPKGGQVTERITMPKGTGSGKGQGKQWQYENAGYGRRMLQAEQVFSNLEKQGYNRATRGQSMLSILPGELQPEALRAQEQAERNFVNATLRKESGAAINKSEFESAEKQYFPRPGDTPQVIAQKRANRLQAIEKMRAGAGPTWEEVKQMAPTELNLKIEEAKHSDWLSRRMGRRELPQMDSRKGASAAPKQKGGKKPAKRKVMSREEFMKSGKVKSFKDWAKDK